MYLELYKIAFKGMRKRKNRRLDKNNSVVLTDLNKDLQLNDVKRASNANVLNTSLGDESRKSLIHLFTNFLNILELIGIFELREIVYIEIH